MLKLTNERDERRRETCSIIMSYKYSVLEKETQSVSFKESFFYCVLDSECDVELYDNYTKCGYMHNKMANLVIIQSHRCMHT